jgi:hypothetical protein
MQVLMNLMGGPNAGAQGAQQPSNGLLGESSSDRGDDMLRNIRFQVGRRDVGASNQRFAPFPPQGVAGPNGGNGNANNMNLAITNGRLMLTGGQQLDGEYVVLVPADGIIGQQGAQPIKKGSSSAGNALRFGSGHLIALVGAMLAMIVL